MNQFSVQTYPRTLMAHPIDFLRMSLHAQRQHGTTWYGTPLGPECEGGTAIPVLATNR